MNWFNYYGLIAIILIIIPNILCAIFDKDAFANENCNKIVSVLEQIGRFGCIIFMIFNIPFTYFHFWFEPALAVYLITVGVLLVLYYLGWIIFRKKTRLRGLWLSIIPTALFLFCGLMLLSLPLIVSAILFGIGHITISYKNNL